MLQHLRDNSKGVVSGILIGLLVIIFTLTGADALFSRDAASQSVVEVNGEKISENDIARAVASQKQQMMARYGDSVPAEFLTDEYLRNPALENLIERKLLLGAATSAGFAVSDANINQQILTTPQFQQEDGVFDRDRFQLVLRNIGYTPSTYRNVLAEDVVINQLGRGVLETSFVTPAELETIISLNFQTRDFSYVVLPAEKIRDEVVVNDQEIESYYENNPQEFTIPEQVAVDYIELSVDSLMPETEITEAQVRQQYEQNLASFVATPERQAAHILIESSDEKVVTEISEKLANGEDFAELAKTYSDDLGSREQGGDLGFTTGDTFPVEFEEALATLSVGGVSAPVVTDAGTHFIKKLAERGTEVPPFEEQRERIAEQLKRAQAENTFVELLDRLRDLSYNAEDLGDVANELNLPYQNTGLFSRMGGEGVAAESLFVNAAFSTDVLEQGNSSEVLELSPSRVIVLKKTDYAAANVSPLESVREQIVNIVREQKARDLLAAQAADLKQKVIAGQPLAEVAQAAGLEVVALEGVDRNNATADKDVLRHVFTMPRPMSDLPAVDSLPTASGDYALIALRGVTLGGEKIPAQQQQIIAAQLGSISGQNEYRSYQKLLRDTAKIERD